MITRVPVIFDKNEYEALYQAARNDLRNPADQARYIVRQELERLGLLPDETHAVTGQRKGRTHASDN